MSLCVLALKFLSVQISVCLFLWGGGGSGAQEGEQTPPPPLYITDTYCIM